MITGRTRTALVVIVDDHAFVADSLANAITARTALTTRVLHPLTPDLVPTIVDLDPDLVLADLALGDGTIFGLPLLAELSAIPVTTAVFTGSENEALLGECLEHGAVGIISKALPFDDALRLIDAALEGAQVNPDGDAYRWLLAAMKAREQRRARLGPFERLTAREQAVLAALVQGRTPEAIAEASFVSVVTVRSQIRTMFAKLGVHSQIAAVAMARDAGWEPPA